jgi:hypothetical protein
MQKVIANIAFFALMLMNSFFLHGQDTSLRRNFEWRVRDFRKTEILTGISWQQDGSDHKKSLHYAELGIAKSIHSYSHYGPVSFGIYAAEEILFGNNSNVYGTKIGSYLHWLIDFGLAMIYYTDFKKGNIKIRPEFGIGMGAFRTVIGYNIPTINNKAFELLRKNNGQISIQFLIPVKKKEIKWKEGSIFRQLF